VGATMNSTRNSLFIPGPTNMPDRVRLAMDVVLQDHRAPDIPKFTLPLLSDLKRVFKTETGRIFIFPGSGTGGWEAAITNTLSPGDKVLASVFGQFSYLWINLCQRHGLDVDFLEVPWGEGVPVNLYREHLIADKSYKIKAVLACHNETATGVTSNIAAVRNMLDEIGHPALLLVDGVSSIASVDFRMDEWGVDLAVSGSQKGFMLPAGLAIFGISLKAIEASKSAQCSRCYFDFSDMIKPKDEGYFPYTPAMTLLHGLRESLDMLLEEGLDNVFKRHRRMAEAVRVAVRAWNLNLYAKRPELYSDTTSAICVPNGFDGNEIVKLVYLKYNLSLGLGLSKVAGKVFRIGHLENLDELMVLQCLAGVEMTMSDVGIDITLGAGVAAAQKHFQESAAPMILGEEFVA